MLFKIWKSVKKYPTAESLGAGQAPDTIAITCQARNQERRRWKHSAEVGCSTAQALF